MHFVENDLHGTLSATIFKRNLERAEEPNVTRAAPRLERAARFAALFGGAVLLAIVTLTLDDGPDPDVTPRDAQALREWKALGLV